MRQEPALAAAPSDREWLIPCAFMTAGLGLAALLLMPLAGFTQIPFYFSRFLSWMAYCFFAIAILLPYYLFRIWRAGVEAPVTYLTTRIRELRGAVLVALLGAMLAGLDMLFFMWIKPEIAALSPFWADELFADIDNLLFLGVDPWRLFQGIDLSFHAWAYSVFWGLAFSATLVWLLVQPVSSERSALLLCYFLLWSIFGPVGQFLLSSAGPIFYQRIGLGDRFVELEQGLPQITRDISSYLWGLYENHQLAAGAGISAMPSLHIATIAWIYLVFRMSQSRMEPVAVIFGIYIFALSVALGWHYAIDGLVGAAGALLCYRLGLLYLRRMRRRADAAVSAASAN